VSQVDQIFVESRSSRCSKYWQNPKIASPERARSDLDSESEAVLQLIRRDKHISQHERPFYCTFTGCPFGDLGYANAKNLKKHLSESHPTGHDSDWTFPTRKGRKDMDFFTAAAKGALNVLDKALEEGFDINQISDSSGGRTALMLAAKNNQLAAVNCLLQKGADVDFRRHRGPTALKVAMDAGHVMLVQALLQGGASAKAKYHT